MSEQGAQAGKQRPKPAAKAESPAGKQRQKPAPEAESPAGKQERMPATEAESPAGKTDLKSMMPRQLEDWILSIGEKRFRAVQLYDWMHKKLACGIDEMSNLPAGLRNRLKQETFTVLRTQQVQVSKLDGTRKYLFALEDGNVIESVLMRYHHGNSVCISSQVGCRMGCRFCASTIGGRVRNLTAAEMLEQVYQIRRETGERVSNVVVMGTGEPLDNYDQLLQFIRILSEEHGQNISQRNITVSTCGIVPRMLELAGEELTITLAISLHASSQEKRLQLMPVAKQYELEQLMEACRIYFRKTGRRLTFEYSLVAGVNDTKEDAARLATLLAGLSCHVNLIPVNPVAERTFTAPDRSAVEAFKNKLEKKGINVTIRREMGRDIDGACGQLRRSYLEKHGE